MRLRASWIAAIVVLATAPLACKIRPVDPGAELKDGAAGPTTGAMVDNATYGAHCAAEVGLDPRQLTDMSCLAGEHVPIKFDGETLTSANWETFDRQGRRCDNPQWLGPGDCHPYDIMTMKRVGPVEILLNCRQKYFADQEHEDPALNPGKDKHERARAYAAKVAEGASAAELEKYMQYAFYFDDLGLILRNRDTGKVCFFTKFSGKFFGGFIPSPLRTAAPTEAEIKATLRQALGRDLERLADDERLIAAEHRFTHEFYHHPSGTSGCIGCHAYGGYKYSPFITSIEMLPTFTGSRGTGRKPVLAVGAPIIQSVRDAGRIEVKHNGDATCTSCHRIVSTIGWDARQCHTGFERAVGQHGEYAERHTAAGMRNWNVMAWMPPDHGHETEDAYRKAHAAGIAKIDCCCKHPTARGCSWRRFGPTAAEVDADWRTGTANLGEGWPALEDDSEATCTENGLEGGRPRPAPAGDGGEGGEGGEGGDDGVVDDRAAKDDASHSFAP